VEEAFGRPEEPLLCDAVYEAMPHVSLDMLLERGQPLAVLAFPEVALNGPAIPIAA
jgi:hypothetical protein